MKGRLEKFREWAHSPKYLLFLILVFGGDIVSRDYISKKNEFEVVGCVQRKFAGAAREGHVGLEILTTQGKKEKLFTYDDALIEGMENHIGECFSFSAYKHSILIPNIGDQWLVSVNPIDTKNKGKI